MSNKYFKDTDTPPLSPMGGSEILMEKLIKYTDLKDRNDINILCSTPDSSKILPRCKNILWQHLNYSDESLGAMRDRDFMKSLDATVYISHWQLEKFRYIFQVPLNNAYVIKNAIDPVEFKPRTREGKLKLIYTSTPFRGLDVLLDAFEVIDRDDIELDIYSSMKVYGPGYQEHFGHLYEEMFDRATELDGINYHGYATNETVINALSTAHIFSYPSIFEETSCLAMIEAGAAGCQLVTTDLGALPETGSVYANMSIFNVNRSALVRSYAKHLNNCIDNYWSIETQRLIKEQSDFYNNHYSWERRKHEWDKLFDKISMRYN
jgi:glycosyltransferase involved in cell wall biosynthesis